MYVHSNREKSEQERGTTEKGCFLSPIIHYLQSRALLLAGYVLACVSSPFFIKLPSLSLKIKAAHAHGGAIY